MKIEDVWKLAVCYDSAMFGSGCPKLGTYTPTTSSTQHHAPNKGFTNYRNYKPQNPIPMELDRAEQKKSHPTKNKVTCYNYRKMGHIARECRSNSNPVPKVKVIVIEEQPKPQSSNKLIQIKENQKQLL